mgnify:CR=1 FL=1
MKLPYKRCSPQSSGNSGKAAGGGRHTSTSQRWMHSRHSPNGNRCPCANWARPYWRGSKTSSGRGIAVGTLCPPTSRRYARCIIGRWTESTYGMYQTVWACVYRHTGRQEEGARSIRHQQPGKGDGKEPARRDIPKHTAENKDFLRTHVHAQGHTLRGPGVPAQKGLAGECAVLQKAEDGTGADRVTHTRSHADGENNSKQGQGLSLFIPHITKWGRHGSGIPGIPGGAQGIQPTSGECSRQCLGMQSALSSYAARHTWATMAYHCEIHPGIISEAMGHSSITVTETYLKPFSNRKIDEANQRVISFVRSGACTV